MKINNSVMPHQLQAIIDSMLDPSDNVHIRGNYKFRLETIKKEIDEAIRKYDRELMFKGGSTSSSNNNRKKEKVRG